MQFIDIRTLFGLRAIVTAARLYKET